MLKMMEVDNLQTPDVAGVDHRAGEQPGHVVRVGHQLLLDIMILTTLGEQLLLWCATRQPQKCAALSVFCTDSLSSLAL